MNSNRKSKKNKASVFKSLIPVIDPLSLQFAHDHSPLIRTHLETFLRSEMASNAAFLHHIIIKASIHFTSDEKIQIDHPEILKNTIQEIAVHSLQSLLTNFLKRDAYRKELVAKEGITDLDSEKILTELGEIASNDKYHPTHHLASIEWNKLLQATEETLLLEIHPILYIEEQKHQLTAIETMLLHDLSVTQSPFLQKKLHRAIQTSQTLIRKASKEALGHLDLMKNTDFLHNCLCLHEEVTHRPSKELHDLHEDFDCIEKKIDHLLQKLQPETLQPTNKLSGMEKIKNLIGGLFKFNTIAPPSEVNNESYETLLDHHADDIHTYWADLKILKKQCQHHGIKAEKLGQKIRKLKNRFNEVVRIANFRKHHFVLSGDIEHLLKHVDEQISANEKLELQFHGHYVQKLIQAVRSAEQFKKQQVILNSDNEQQSKIIGKIDNDLQQLISALEELLAGIVDFMQKEKNESIAQYYQALNAYDLEPTANHQGILKNEIKCLRHLLFSAEQLSEILSKSFPYKKPPLIENALIPLQSIQEEINELIKTQKNYDEGKKFTNQEHQNWRRSNKPLTQMYSENYSEESKNTHYSLNSSHDARKVFLNLFFFQFKSTHTSIKRNLKELRIKQFKPTGYTSL